MGAGLAGTYMPGLQILNARLSDDFRVKAVPWYTSSFGLGSGISFLVMGYLLAYSNYTVAALLGAIRGLSLWRLCLLFCITYSSNIKPKQRC